MYKAYGSHNCTQANGEICLFLFLTMDLSGSMLLCLLCILSSSVLLIIPPKTDICIKSHKGNHDFLSSLVLCQCLWIHILSRPAYALFRSITHCALKPQIILLPFSLSFFSLLTVLFNEFLGNLTVHIMAE